MEIKHFCLPVKLPIKITIKPYKRLLCCSSEKSSQFTGSCEKILHLIVKYFRQTYSDITWCVKLSEKLLEGVIKATPSIYIYLKMGCTDILIWNMFCVIAGAFLNIQFLFLLLFYVSIYLLGFLGAFVKSHWLSETAKAFSMIHVRGMSDSISDRRRSELYSIAIPVG